MAHKLQLYHQDGSLMIASDGVMQVDGRYGFERILEEVRSRNKRYEKNFPHKIAGWFSFYPNNSFKYCAETGKCQMSKI